MAKTRSVKAENAGEALSEMLAIVYLEAGKTYQLVRIPRLVGSLDPSNLGLDVDRPIAATQAYIVRM